MSLFQGNFMKIQVEDAKKNLIRIPIKKGTLPHEQKGKYGGAKVFLKPSRTTHF